MQLVLTRDRADSNDVINAFLIGLTELSVKKIQEKALQKLTYLTEAKQFGEAKTTALSYPTSAPRLKLCSLSSGFLA